MKHKLGIFFLILFCSVVSTYNYLSYFVSVCDDCQIIIVKPADDILTGKAEFPFVYRILTPYILQIMGGGLSAIAQFHIFMRFVLLGLLYIWVRHWNGNGLAAVGLMTVLLSIMHYTWYHSDYALTESVLILLSWIILVSSRLTIRHYLTFAILVMLGFLNREITGVLLLLSWFVLHGYKWRWSITYVAVAAAVVIGLRLWIGFVPQQYGVMDIFQRNLVDWRIEGAIMYNIILLPLWLGIILHRRDMPIQYKRLALILIPYAGLFLLFAIWQETRLLMPFALMLFPLIKE